MTRRYVPMLRRRARPPARSPFLALGAIAHWDVNHHVSDDGTDAAWVDRLGGYTVASTSAATRLQYGSYAALNGRHGWLGSSAAVSRLTGAAALANVIDLTQAHTILSVAKRASVHNGTLVGLGGTVGHVACLNVTSPDALAYERFDGAYAATGVAIVSPGDIHVYASTFDGSGASVYSDGALVISAALGLAPNATSFTIGNREAAAGVFDLPFDGHIGDVVVFDSALNGAQVLAASNILAAKFGF